MLRIKNVHIDILKSGSIMFANNMNCSKLEDGVM